jgi:hypothetical protein
MVRVRGRAVWLAAAACVAAAPGCTEEQAWRDSRQTRLTVAVWTDLDVPLTVGVVQGTLRQDRLEVFGTRVLGRDQEQPIAFTLGTGFMDRARPMDLIVDGRSGSLVVVQRRLRYPRLPAGEAAVAVTLERRCAGVSCDDGWTCFRGRCERPDVAERDVAVSVDALPADPLAGLVEAQPIEGCVTDVDCDDGDPCTIDDCSSNRCSRQVLDEPDCHVCSADSDCADFSSACMESYCLLPHDVCWWRARRPGLRCDDDDDPCTIQCCRELGQCLSFDVCPSMDAGATGCDPEP